MPSAVFAANALWLGQYDRKRSPSTDATNPRGHWPQPAGERPVNWPYNDSGPTDVLLVIPTAPWCHFVRMGEWQPGAPLQDSSFQVLQSEPRRASIGITPLTRAGFPALEAAAGNWTWVVTFKHNVKRRNNWALETFKIAQKRELFDSFQTYDDTLVEIGTGQQYFIVSAVNVTSNAITLNAHGYLDGKAVFLWSSGTLPAPLVAYTRYYVTDKDTNTFKLSTTGVTLTSVTATALTDIITKVAHGLAVNQAVVFRSVGSSGLTAGTTYYVITSGLTADAFKVSTSISGSAVNITSDTIDMTCAPIIDLTNQGSPGGAVHVILGAEFICPNRPEKYFELFTGDFLKDVILFRDGHTTDYFVGHPYHGQQALLESSTAVNVVFGATSVTIASDAWALGFRPGMVCSIGMYDLENHPGDQVTGGILIGTELIKIASIAETSPGNGLWRVLNLVDPISRPPASGYSYTAGMHVRGFLGLYRAMRLDGITSELHDPQTGRSATISYNFTAAANPLLVDLDEAVPFGIVFAAFTAAADDWITSANHGLLDGQRVVLWSEGTMPGGLNNLGAYYVRDKTASTFKVEPAIYSVSAVTATVTTNLITVGSPVVAHGLQIGWAIKFGSVGASGLTAGLRYFVIANGFTSTQFKVSTSPTGTEVSIAATQTGMTCTSEPVDITNAGSGTHRWIRIDGDGGIPDGGTDEFRNQRWP